MHQLRPQDIGNVLWAFGRLRYKAVKLLDEVPLHLGPWLHQFTPRDMCCVLVGYTHARHYHRGVLDALAPLLAARANQLSSYELTVSLWAYGIFQHVPSTAPHFADAMSNALVPHLYTARPQVLAVAAKALANLRARPQPFLRVLVRAAEQRVGELRPDEMAQLLYGISHIALQARRQEQWQRQQPSSSSSQSSRTSHQQCDSWPGERDYSSNGAGPSHSDPTTDGVPRRTQHVWRGSANGSRGSSQYGNSSMPQQLHQDGRPQWQPHSSAAPWPMPLPATAIEISAQTDAPVPLLTPEDMTVFHAVVRQYLWYLEGRSEEVNRAMHIHFKVGGPHVCISIHAV